jgi:outer membrane protein assembly factor BamD (BamD/ComL family)
VPVAPRPSWRELSAAGKYPEALVAAEGEGFARICAEGSAADLRDLADAARLSGHAARAVEALGTLRRRFAGSEQAAEAAYLLGILAFDGAPAEAARWFGVYLGERPAGRLSREASGRLIEAAERGGDRAGAKAAAQRYLRDHPGGPHAEMARALVEGG